MDAAMQIDSSTECYLLKTPVELQLRIFSYITMPDPREPEESYIFNLGFNCIDSHYNGLLSANYMLGQYGSLCRDLRNVAVQAYYENNVLQLYGQEDPQFIKSESMHKPNQLQLGRSNWTRYGRVYPGIDSGLVTQYAMELPPRYTTAYGDESNDWLAPIFDLKKKYGFVKASDVTVEFEFFDADRWDEGDVDLLKVWVMEQLCESEHTETMLRDGSLKLLFENEE
ncbi:hypothetical protein LTR37_001623 [Vermiconidia calcicola]|uniref:Uncharacterized protein n=1 Tax=Vermiconidia calcicola TaxID=1690605 RepID=A0ACC3NV75_9PEZI|nr:hypothetical protein LTR37_001623 [Vermiconidia calcicola]